MPNHPTIAPPPPDPFESERFQDLIETPRVSREEGRALGRSREGRPVRGFRFGNGRLAVSLLGGCHADEPVGPRLLRHLVAYLRRLPPGDPWIRGYEWWIVPHINPDGEERNVGWADEDAGAYDLGRYLRDALREPPGEDIEFGFPQGPSDDGTRPENLSIYEWWRTCDRPFALHASLHGTAFAAGPWFLIEPAWRDRYGPLRDRCIETVSRLGYTLHDVERKGEKGFVRLERGFCTRPDSVSMRAYFTALGDPGTASLFRPSSMETIRAFGGDPLTLVSEMPLFITPGVGEVLGPPDPVLLGWGERLARWKAGAHGDENPSAITKRAKSAGLVAMPVIDQMHLQWTLVRAGQALACGEEAQA